MCDEIDNLKIHDPLIAAFIRHPWYYKLHAIRDTQSQAELQDRDVCLIRKLMQRFSTNENSSDDPRKAAVPNILVGERSVALKNMSFGVIIESGKLTLYECELLAESSIADIKNDGEEIRYWVTKRSSYLALSQVAMWRRLCLFRLSLANGTSAFLKG